MALTSKQREVLNILRTTGAVLITPRYRAAYISVGGNSLRTVNATLMRGIEPFLTRFDDRSYAFKIKDEAEISDSWLEKELARIEYERSEKIREYNESVTNQATEKRARILRLKEVLEATGLGFSDTGEHLSFEFEGKGFSIRQWRD